ncbi:hypothetical protein Anapl_05467 [Anas platyrhynchos]|uniref:Uncharacterized protein n=1 Tax=Anas platyrhynchos TaxID=8839 RepID=R0LIZ5_ANAPL|nr:hypothetical protein Anapl_05467 [Anas platyrhynchos]
MKLYIQGTGVGSLGDTNPYCRSFSTRHQSKSEKHQMQPSCKRARLRALQCGAGALELLPRDQRHSSAGNGMEKNPLEIQLLYEQKLDNNYFANSNKTTPAMHITSFFSPGKVNILCLSLPQFRGIPQGFAARPEELQNRNLPGSRGCSQVSSKNGKETFPRSTWCKRESSRKASRRVTRPKTSCKQIGKSTEMGGRRGRAAQPQIWVIVVYTRTSNAHESQQKTRQLGSFTQGCEHSNI